ncbi:MAG TPA: RNA 2',3'-cyclic phosphodiesterase [Thermoplasmata archaeon]
MKFRAFISADIVPSDSLAALLRELAHSRADLKIVRPELMHVTLKFLGDTDEGIVDEVVARMATASSGVRPFTIRLSGMGAFPSLSNIRVVWVGIEDGSLLGSIAGRLDTLMKDLGFERDKKGFKPHLTLARTRSGRNIANVQEILRSNAATDYGSYMIDRVILKKSVLGPSGPTYSTVREVLLA